MIRKFLARCLHLAALTALLGCPANKGKDTPSEQPDAGDDASACSEEPAQVDKVDVLLVVDNSSGMAFPQKKLAAALPGFFSSLTETPIQSLHIGVVTTDMGVNDAPALVGCGERSLPLIDDGTRVPRYLNKLVGDDGMLQVDTSVASNGLWAPRLEDSKVVEVDAADPACADVKFPQDARFVDFNAGDDPDSAAQQLSCITKRGLNGCRFEQPLEAALKALTPPSSSLKFAERSPDGHGNATQPEEPSGFNKNFLREDALLAVLIVTNGADCSSPSRDLFDPAPEAARGALGPRCGLRENELLLHSLTRYSEGFAAVKPRERMIFAALTGIPRAAWSGSETHSGWNALYTILARPDMQFQVLRQRDDEPVPSCTSETDDTRAAPGRRYLQLGMTFAGNSLVSSLCEDDYAPFFAAMTEKIVGLLTPQPSSCISDAGR